MTTTSVVDSHGAGVNWATVDRWRGEGRPVGRQRKKKKFKSVELRVGTSNVGYQMLLELLCRVTGHSRIDHNLKSLSGNPHACSSVFYIFKSLQAFFFLTWLSLFYHITAPMQLTLRKFIKTFGKSQL